MPSPPSTRPSDARGRRSSAFVREYSGTATGPALLVDQRQPRGQGGEGPIGPPRIRDTKASDLYPPPGRGRAERRVGARLFSRPIASSASQPSWASTA